MKALLLTAVLFAAGCAETRGRAWGPCYGNKTCDPGHMCFFGHNEAGGEMSVCIPYKGTSYRGSPPTEGNEESHAAPPKGDPALEL